jgi:hypothetical protein
MKNLTLQQLYDFHSQMISEKYSENDIQIVNDLIVEKESNLLEFTSATGGPSGSVGASNVGYGSTGIGMRTSVGPVPDQQPGFPGETRGTSWMDSNDGDGNLKIPYNPTGKNRVFQKIASPMGKGHGAQTGKKSRVKPLDIKALKNMFAKKQKGNSTMTQSEKPKKVMNFDDFAKGEMTQVTKVKEGKAYQATKGPKDKKIGKEGVGLTNKKESFRTQINNLLKSHKNLEVSRVGNDFEVGKEGKMILQVMFRDDYVGVKKAGAKFTDEFKYTELGKIKSSINAIVK